MSAPKIWPGQWPGQVSGYGLIVQESWLRERVRQSGVDEQFALAIQADGGKIYGFSVDELLQYARAREEI
jgi:hypothetical protein